jgi:hypothetical protein
MTGQTTDSPGITPESQRQGCLGTILRITWILPGNVVLLFLLVLIVQRKGFTLFDPIFWAALAALVLVRYVDVKFLKGQTSNAEPATMRDWRKYLVRLLGIGGGGWVIAHVVSLLLHR